MSKATSVTDHYDFSPFRVLNITVQCSGWQWIGTGSSRRHVRMYSFEGEDFYYNHSGYGQMLFNSGKRTLACEARFGAQGWGRTMTFSQCKKALKALIYRGRLMVHRPTQDRTFLNLVNDYDALALVRAICKDRSFAPCTCRYHSRGVVR
jgi:hypothetical protein